MDWRYQGNNRDGWTAKVSDTRHLRVFFWRDGDDQPGSWVYGVGSLESGELLSWIYPVGTAVNLAEAKRLAAELWETGPEREA